MNQPFFVLVHNREDEDYLRGRGYESILKIESISLETMVPIFDYPIRKIVIFEARFFDCCSLIRMIRSLTNIPVYLVTPD